jgi:hypothetical protein
MDSGGLPGWGVNWVWGLPLIVLTVVSTLPGWAF